jgi:5-methylcytosine-specific restriction endonuclease McrA
MGDIRDTYAWKKARKTALLGATHCQICWEPLDFDAPPRSRWSPSVDHIVALALGGAPFAQSNLRVVHAFCNSSAGATLGNRMRPRAPSRPGRRSSGRRARARAINPVEYLEPVERARWW